MRLLVCSITLYRILRTAVVSCGIDNSLAARLDTVHSRYEYCMTIFIHELLCST